MADPQQKSLQPPVLWRIPTMWQIPQWQQATQWRWFVYNQPIAMLCRQRLINYLLGLPWEIVARNPNEQEALREDCRYYTDWVLVHFDTFVDKLWQDALDLPIGGNIEIVRWPVATLPAIQDGPETYMVTREHPRGHPFKLVNIDGSTLFPTYAPDLPVAQRIAETDTVVYFTPDQLGRIIIQPRTEMRLNGYGKAPPEQIYLAMQMVNHGDHYYSDLLKNVPSAGILDLMDMSQNSATEWTSSVRTLFEGNDPFKVPVLYEHTTAAQFIPFGKSPQELLFNDTTLRYARIVVACYGLTLGNLGLEPKGESLAGSIRDDMQAETGYSFVVEKTKGLLEDEILPPYLEWQPKLQNYEKLAGRGKAFLVFAQALKVARDAGALKPSEVQTQLKREGFITIEVAAPDDKAPPPAPGFGRLPGSSAPAENGANGKELAQQVTEKKAPAEGGRGEITGKALVELADVRPTFSQAIGKAIGRIAAQATPARLKKLARGAVKILFPLLEKADLEEWERDLDRLINGETWYLLPSDFQAALLDSYTGAFSQGALAGALEVMRALGETTAGISFDLTNPATLAQLEDTAALLVRRINEGTQYYLKRMLVGGVEEGLASPRIAALIKEGANLETILKDAGFLDEIVGKVKAELDAMTPGRVESIVNTEINRTENEGRRRQWQSMGLTHKQWVHTGPDVACEICMGNEALGFVPMDYVYQDVFDGTQGPPGHPRVCHCHLEFDEGELMDRAGELKVWSGD